MRRAESELGDSNVGVAGDIQAAAGARIIVTVDAEYQYEVNALGIGRWRDNRNCYGPILISATDANQA